MISNTEDKRKILKEKVQTLRMKIQELGEANASEETMEKARADLEQALTALDASNPFRNIAIPNYRLIGEYLSNRDKFDLLHLCLEEKPKQLKEKKYDVLKWLFVSGIMDVCRLKHAQGQARPVKYDRLMFEGESCMFMTATDAYMTIMKDLVESCEGDVCNEVQGDPPVPVSPWLFTDGETKEPLKITNVPVNDEISETMDTLTFTGLVWISSIKKIVAVRVMVKEEGSKRQAFAVIGSTDSKYVTNLNSLGLNVDLKFGRYLEAPLIYTSLKGRLDEVKVLLEADANVNEKDNDGDTALVRASLKGHLQVVQELLKMEGINVNENG